MKKVGFRKVLIVIVCISFAVICPILLCNYMLNKHSVPDKDERIYNLRVYSGITDLNELDDSLIANDICAALEKHTNWDNLFLSENFKEKYKNRSSILDDVRHIANIHSGITYQDGEPVILIFADKKTSLFDIDESDDTTTMYYFRYILNDAGEIDDLILLKKQDVYTINGEPIGENESYGWQE